jgi:hypothetical protein
MTPQPFARRVNMLRHAGPVLLETAAWRGVPAPLGTCCQRYDNVPGLPTPPERLYGIEAARRHPQPRPPGSSVHSGGSLFGLLRPAGLL